MNQLNIKPFSGDGNMTQNSTVKPGDVGVLHRHRNGNQEASACYSKLSEQSQEATFMLELN